MAQFITKESPIDGPIIIKPATLGVSRDYLLDPTTEEAVASFAEMGFAEREFESHAERCARGVMRGLHFQRKESYARLIAVTSGRILAVAVDLRPESKTFGASQSVELTADNETMFYIPPYFAHGFMTLEPNTEVVTNCAGHYDPSQESGIIYDDEVLAIDWQFERYEIDEKYLNISQRDKRNNSFRMYNPNDLWINRPKKSKYAIRY